MNDAKEVTKTNTQSADPYGKIWEYANIFFDVDEEVINEVRHEGEEEVKTSTGCLVGIIGMLIIFCLHYLYSKAKFG